jgi:hypothetical protein
MNQPWSYLCLRYGEEVAAPSEAQLTKAAQELFHENSDGMTESDYLEHGSSHLRVGYDNGPMYVLTIDRTGRATLEVWADQDYEVEACAPRELEKVGMNQAIQLWTDLASSEIEKVEAAFNAGS